MEAKIIEEICKNGLEYAMLGSLISSDNILTEDDAHKALEAISDVDNALYDADIDENKKIEIRRFLNKGRGILFADMQRFREEKKM